MNAYQKSVGKEKNCQCYHPIYIAAIGPSGTPGPIGPTGPTGATPSFSIGSVTTGEPGTQASVSITPIFNK